MTAGSDCTTIRAEVVDGLGMLTLARPEVGNAIDLTMARELDEVTTAWADDPAVRAVLLQAEGRSFCVGGDLKTFAACEDLPALLTEITAHLHAALARLAGMDVPVVAAVQGSAAGGGVGVATSADLVLVGTSTRFVLAFTAIGLSPDSSSTWSLPRTVGLRRALDLALTNRAVTADEAVAEGLATRSSRTTLWPTRRSPSPARSPAGPRVPSVRRNACCGAPWPTTSRRSSRWSRRRSPPPAARPTPARASPRSSTSAHPTYAGRQRW